MLVEDIRELDKHSTLLKQSGNKKLFLMKQKNYNDILKNFIKCFTFIQGSVNLYTIPIIFKKFTTQEEHCSTKTKKSKTIIYLKNTSKSLSVYKPPSVLYKCYNLTLSKQNQQLIIYYSGSISIIHLSKNSEN